MAYDLIYKGQKNGQQVEFVTGNLSDISTFDTDVRASAIENQIVDGVTDRGASQDALITMSGAIAASAHPTVSPGDSIAVTDNTAGTVIQNITVTVDGTGHVTTTAVSSKDLNDVYYTEQEIDTRFNNTGVIINSIDTKLIAATGYITGLIGDNDTDIAGLQSATGSLNTRVGTTESDISGLQSLTGQVRIDIDANGTAITALQGLTGDVRDDIDDLAALTGQVRTDIDANGTAITALQGLTGQVRTDIDSLAALSGQVRTDIDQNVSDITALETATGHLKSKANSFDAVTGNYLSWGIDNVLAVDNTTIKDLRVGDLTGDSLRVQGDGTSATISGPATITIDPDAAGAAGTVVIQGDLQVEGTTTTINSTEVQVGDINLVLGTGSANDEAMDDGGLILSGTHGTVASFLYNQSSDEWASDLPISATTFRGALAGNASTASQWANSRSITFEGGDVTGLISSLNGSANVSSVDLTIAPTSIENGMIANGTIATGKLANSQVTVSAGNGLADGGTVGLGETITLNVGGGHGINANTNDISIDLDGSTLSVSADGLKLPDVVAGGSFTAADITVDNQGRITAVANGTISSAEIASQAVVSGKLGADSVGKFELAADVAGDNITFTNGVLSVTDATITSATSGAASTIVSNDLTADRALVSNTNGKVEVSPITTGELAQLDGIGSTTVATQLAAKVPTSRSVTAGNGLSGGGTLSANRSFSTDADQNHLVGMDFGSGIDQITNVITQGGVKVLKATANSGITEYPSSNEVAILLNDKTTVSFEGVVQSARVDQNSDNGSYVAMWKVQGTLKRDADSTNMLQSFVTQTYVGSNATGYNLNVSVDGNYLKIASDQTSSNLVTCGTINYNWIEYTQ